MTYRDEIAEMLRKMPLDWRRQYRSGRDKLGVALPDVPTPEQAMMLIGITAGGHESGDTPSGNNRVPQAVKEAAMKGIRLSYKNNYGAWDFIGLARAIELVLMTGVSDRTTERMRNYFVRHRKDKLGRNYGNDASPSRGYMAWLNWGGDPGQEWTMRKNTRRNPAYSIETDKNLFRIVVDGADSGKYATTEEKARAIIEKMKAAEGKAPKKEKKYRPPLLVERVSPLRQLTTPAGAGRPTRRDVEEAEEFAVKRGTYRFVGTGISSRPVWGERFINEYEARGGEQYVVVIQPLGPRRRTGVNYSAMFLGMSDDTVRPRRDVRGLVYLIPEGPTGSPIILTPATLAMRLTPGDISSGEFTEEIVNIGINARAGRDTTPERLGGDIGEFFR